MTEVGGMNDRAIGNIGYPYSSVTSERGRGNGRTGWLPLPLYIPVEVYAASL